MLMVHLVESSPIAVIVDASQIHFYLFLALPNRDRLLFPRRCALKWVYSEKICVYPWTMTLVVLCVKLVFGGSKFH